MMGISREMVINQINKVLSGKNVNLSGTKYWVMYQASEGGTALFINDSLDDLPDDLVHVATTEDNKIIEIYI